MSKVVLIGPIIQNLILFRAELIAELQKTGYKLIIITSGNSENILPGDNIKIINVSIDRRGTSIFNDLKLCYNYYKIIKQEKPDVVLTYTTKCSVYGGLACTLGKIPYIINNSGLYNKEDFSKIMWFVLKFLYKTGYSHTACMMYQNHYERDELNRILNHKVKYIDIPGSGVSLDKYKYTPYPLDNQGIIFNYVARIVNIKGINEYLACAKIIKSKYPQTVFRIFGSYDDDSYKQLVEDYVKNGYVKYYGPQSKMLPYVESCHAVIHPSYYEGMTNVVLEHSAVGRVCIASDIPGCREGIEDGVTGYLFEKKNVNQLVAAVEKFILLPLEEKAKMGRKARRKMEREFDRKIVTETYVKEIEKICRNN